VAQGATIVGFTSFRDHARLSRARLAREEAAASGAGARLVTTAKDATRWEARLDPAAGWHVAERAWRASAGWDAVWARLTDGLGL
jgi:tetraacyldisaccharide-1-P 4'-kinase